MLAPASIMSIMSLSFGAYKWSLFRLVRRAQRERKPREKFGLAKYWEQEAQDFARPFFPRGLFPVTLTKPTTDDTQRSL